MTVVVQWGSQRWGSMHQMFKYCEQVQLRANDKPELRQVTDMSAMFYEAKAFNQPLAKWKVGADVNVEEMFQGADAFKQDLSAWEAKPKRP